MINYILLAISVSIDSLGIGITYGIRNTKTLFSSKIILFLISIFITSFAMLIGNFISTILPNNFSNYIGVLILVFLGIWIIYQSNSNTVSFDFDNSKTIDCKEALYLGFALSLDSIGVGIGSSIVGFNSFLFPILVATFQLIFLSLGSLFGKKIIASIKLSKNIWSVISGILLIAIGLCRLLVL